MAEPRDEVREHIVLILTDLKEDILNRDALKPPDNYVELVAKEILSIRELAIVDRNAKLPSIEWELPAYCAGQNSMVLEGWVKEIK